MKVSLFQGILFGVFIIGALIGLFVFATYTSKNTTAGGSPVLIWGTLSRDAIQATIATINQTGNGLKNVSYMQKDPATLPTELATAIATGEAPDLVLASQEEFNTLQKFITPIPYATLPANTFANTFVGAGNLFASAEGYYGIPFLVDPLVLFSNHSILSSAGIARPPATWEALTGLVPKVAQLTSSRQVTRGLIALGTYSNVHNGRGILSSLFLQTGVPLSQRSPGGNLAANLGGTSATNGATPGSAVLGFYTQFADPSKVSYTWNASLPDSQQMFLTGNLALYIGYASEALYFREANPNLNFNVTFLPQPATATAKSVYGLVYAFMVPNGAKNVTGAYTTSSLLTNSFAQTTAAAKTGLAPATLSQLMAAPADPVATVAYAEALYAVGWLSPMPGSTNSIFSSMINDVISGRSSINAALNSAEQSLSALLQK